MRLTALAVLSLSILILSSACSHAPKQTALEKPVTAPKLVLISVDGMRPDFYTRPEYRKVAPTLATLSDQGEIAAHGITPVFPSLTYPNHTSMVTGAYSSEHGIYHNRIYSPTEGPTDAWNWYESAIRVPTLWQVAEKAGLKVAILRWPASVGARVTWEIPEIFAGNKGFNAVADWDAVTKNTDAEFLKHVLGKGPVKIPQSIADMDQIDTQAAEWVLREGGADLILIHLIDVDHIQHLFGTDAPEVRQSLHSVDGQIARIVALLDPKKTTVIVTGDHGFATYTQMINVAPLIREAGLFEQVVAQTDGGEAAIFAKPGGRPFSQSQKDVCGILAHTAERHLKGLLLSIPKRRLRQLHAYPDALCALEAKIGTAFGFKTSALVVEPTDHPRGHHGYLPTRPEMKAGFFIWGKGLSHPGQPLDQDPVMVDIAPTAAEILGITFRTPAGTAIRF